MNLLIEEAKKHLDRVDFIIDLYDMSYVWISPKLLEGIEYSVEEMPNLRSIDLLYDASERSKYRESLSEWLREKQGKTTLIFRTKTGKKIQAEAEYYVFNYEGGCYLAGKGIKHEYIP